MPNYKFIVMTAGYVESAKTAVLVYQCEFFGSAGYSTIETAITDLALDFYHKFYDEHLSVYEDRYCREYKHCCTESLIYSKGQITCVTCGRELLDKKFDPEEFCEFIHNLYNTDCNSYGEAEYASNHRMNWWPWGIDALIGAPKEEVIVIKEQAELVILNYLFKAKPELVDKENEFYQDFEYMNEDDSFTIK